MWTLSCHFVYHCLLVTEQTAECGNSLVARSVTARLGTTRHDFLFSFRKLYKHFLLFFLFLDYEQTEVKSFLLQISFRS